MPLSPVFSFPSFVRPLVAGILCALLTACGGSASPDATGERAATTAETDGAVLSRTELAAAEKQAVAADASPSPAPLDALPAGQIAAKSAYVSGAVARKALAVSTPVYRFYNGSTGAHFFTTSTVERDNIVATLSPPFGLEGAAFSVASAFSPGLSPVHRFFNTQTGVHFYTISEAERASVVATLPHFLYEGVAYHASQVAGAGLIPFYRFFVPSKGFHFYTASESEKNSIIANLSATYSFEGVGYHVLDSDWRAEKLPNTGVGSAQCLQAGSNTLVVCTDSAATSLSVQQDGHRININPMRFLLLTGFTSDQCMADEITGLVWEGKTGTGTRAGSNTYTRLGNNAATDTSGYVAAVNALALCGFTDWRMPTALELQTMVRYGDTSPPMALSKGPAGTQAGEYWSSDTSSGSTGFTTSFADGMVFTDSTSNAHHVRLVRGSRLNGPRFSFGSVSYAGDAANNLVNDALTGLQWRRCLEGMNWNGSTCTGTAGSFSQEQALARAREQGGWRLPNIKELGSLVDRTRTASPRIDTNAFPALGQPAAWSSTPLVANTAGAWAVGFTTGAVGYTSRTDLTGVRLVRINP